MTMIPHHYGFTASRFGPTKAQFAWFASIMVSVNMVGFHHGGCIGGDAAAHRIAMDYFDGANDQPITVHPPEDQTRMDGLCKLEGPLVRVRPPKPFLLRNRDIVDETVLLFALPDGPERLRSGTWSTIRYARRLGRPLALCWPDGEPKFERAERWGWI